MNGNTNGLECEEQSLRNTSKALRPVGGVCIHT